jgi:hypothetical protein
MPTGRRRRARSILGTVLLFWVAGCSSACPEPFGKQHALLFVTPLDGLTDGGQMELTIPQHYFNSDRAHSCPTWDFDFDNTQIQATGTGSLTVVTAERIPTSDPSWKAGGYRVVVECHLPAGSGGASDKINVSVVRDGQTLYADQWMQPCKRP